MRLNNLYFYLKEGDFLTKKDEQRVICKKGNDLKYIWRKIPKVIIGFKYNKLKYGLVRRSNQYLIINKNEIKKLTRCLICNNLMSSCNCLYQLPMPSMSTSNYCYDIDTSLIEPYLINAYLSEGSIILK